MDKHLELEKEYANLISRNAEIRLLKTHPKFRIVIAETVKEYTQLEREEKANHHRIDEIEMIRRKRV